MEQPPVQAMVQQWPFNLILTAAPLWPDYQMNRPAQKWIMGGRLFSGE